VRWLRIAENVILTSSICNVTLFRFIFRRFMMLSRLTVISSMGKSVRDEQSY